MRRRPWLVIPLLVIAGGWVPGAAAPVPIRQVGDQAAWSTSTAVLQRFAATGEIRDRGLVQLLERSGWATDDLRLALAKPYRVDSLALARFLNSPAGERFLAGSVGRYTPQKAPTMAVVALRSAIVAAAEDGTLSSLDLLAHLPTSFDLHLNGDLDWTAMPVCGAGSHLAGWRGRSWLSWLVFLPACLQAASVSGDHGDAAIPGQKGRQGR